MPCSATIRKVGDVAVVDLSGRFTTADAPGLIRSTVNGELESGTRDILLNLAKVKYLDSAAGIGELVDSFTRTVRQGGRLKLLNVDKNIDYVLRITRLRDIFEIYDDEAEAIGSFRESKGDAAAQFSQ